MFEGKVMGIPKKSEEELLEEAQMKRDVLGGHSAALQPMDINNKIMGGGTMTKMEEKLPSLGGAGDYQDRLDGLLGPGGKGKTAQDITSDILGGGLNTKAASLLGEGSDLNARQRAESMLGLGPAPKGKKGKKAKKQFDPTDNILGTFNSNLKVGQFANVNNMFGNSKPGKVNTQQKVKEFVSVNPTKTKTKEANPFRNGYSTPVNVSAMLGLGAGGAAAGKVGQVLGKAMNGPNPVEKILGGTKTPQKGQNPLGGQFDVNKILGAGEGKAPSVPTGLDPQAQINKILGKGPAKTGQHSQSVNVEKFLPSLGQGNPQGRILGKEWAVPDFRNPAMVGFERANQQVGLSMFGDYDGDGLKNAIDCDPRDKTEQGFFEKVGNFASGRGFKDDSTIGKEAADAAAQGAIPQTGSLGGVQQKGGGVGLRNVNNPIGLKKVRGGVDYGGNKLPAYGVTRGRPSKGVAVSDASMPDTQGTVQAIQNPETGEVVILDAQGNPVSDQTYELAARPAALDNLKDGVVAAGQKLGAGAVAVGNTLKDVAKTYVGEPIKEAADTQLERGRMGRAAKLADSTAALQTAEYKVQVKKAMLDGEKPKDMDAETWHMMQRQALTGFVGAGQAQAVAQGEAKLALDKQQAKEKFKLERMKARSQVEIADAKAEARAGGDNATTGFGKSTKQLKNALAAAAGGFGGMKANVGSKAVQAGEAMSAAMGTGDGMSLADRPMSKVTGFEGGTAQADATSFNLTRMSAVGQSAAMNEYNMGVAAQLGPGGGLSGGLAQMSNLGGHGDYSYKVAESLGESATKQIGQKSDDVAAVTSQPGFDLPKPAPQPVQQAPAPQPVQQVQPQPAPQPQAPPIPVTPETVPGNGISKSSQRLRQEYMASRPDKPPLPDGRVWSPRSRKYVKYPRGQYKDNDPTK